MEPLKGIAIASAVSLVCLLFGARLLTLLRLKPASLAERALLAAGVGYVAVAYLVLAIGLLGQLYLSRILIMLGVCLLIGATEWPLLRDCLVRVRDRLRPKRLFSAWSLIYLLITAGLLLSLMDCLAPPSFTDWDGLSHHLSVPAEYIRHHDIHYVPWTSHSNQPYTTQMFFTIGLLLRGTDAAKLFHFAYTVLTLGALWAFGRRFLGGRAGALAALAYCAIPLVAWLSGVAYADLGLAFFTVLALHFFLTWARDGESKGLWLAALAAACGMTVKMQALLVFAILCGMVAVALALKARKDSRASRARVCLEAFGRLASFAGLALAVASPWYIKTTIYTGNPVYPFAYGIFDGRNWSVENAEAYRRHQAEFGMAPAGREGEGLPSPRTLKNLLLLPWNMTMRPWYFNEHTFRQEGRHFPPIAWGSAGVAFLAFVPASLLVLLLFRPRRVALYWVLAFAAVFGLATFWLMQYVRYTLPALAALCPVVAWPITVALRRRSPSAYVAISVLVLSTVSTGFLHWAYSYQLLHVAVGLESDRKYLARTCDTYPATQFLNSAAIPAGAKIGTYGEPRVFYIKHDVMWADPGHHEMIDYHNIETPEELLAAYRQVGLDYLLLSGTFRRQVADDARRESAAGRPTFLTVFREARARGYLEPLPAEWIKPYEVLRINYGKLPPEHRDTPRMPLNSDIWHGPSL